MHLSLRNSKLNYGSFFFLLGKEAFDGENASSKNKRQLKRNEELSLGASA